MNWRRKFVVGAAVVMSATGLLLSSCGDDGPTDPPPPQEVPQDIAREQTIAVLSQVDGMLNMVPGVVDGNVGGNPGGIPVPKAAQREVGDLVQEPTCSSAGYDMEEGAWIWACTDTSETGNSSYDYYVKYLAGEEPQPFPDSTTTEIAFRLAWAWDYSISEGDPETDGFLIDYAFVYEFEMNVTDLQMPSYHAVGTGAMGGDWTVVTPEGRQSYSFDMTWATDVFVPAEGGCQTGTTTVNMGIWTMLATYDGTPTYSWTLFENGAEVDSGTRTASCVAAPPPLN